MNNIINTEFKLAKTVMLLCFFQVITGIAISLTLYVLIDLLEVLPTSIGNNSSFGMIGIICGSMSFGQWMEKRHPNVLTVDRIKKISLFTTFINFLLTTIIVLLLVYADYGKIDDPMLIGIFTFIILIATLLTYFCTKYFVTSGIKAYKKRIQKEIK